MSPDPQIQRSPRGPRTALPRRSGEGGFTLLELLLAVVMVGILAGLAVASNVNYMKNTRATEAVNAIGSIVASQRAYYDDETQGDGNFAGDLDTLGWSMKGGGTLGKYWSYYSDDRHVEATALDTTRVNYSQIRYHLHYEDEPEGRTDTLEFRR